MHRQSLRVLSLLSDVPQSIARHLMPCIDSTFQGKITAEIKEKLQLSLGMSEQELSLALLPIAAKFSVAPVSQFHVGAIVTDDDGNMYMGANLEIRNEALFHSVHAEQTAISHAWQDGATGIRSITLNTTPCGHCRQFILELDLHSDIMVHVSGKPSYRLQELIHEPFSLGLLDINNSLFHHQQHQLKASGDDRLVIKTIEQANLSYAPYSMNYAAVGIETFSKGIFFGRYAENAAFNPSLLPMQCALSAYARAGLDLNEIKRVVLVEAESGKISLRNASVNALCAVSKVTLEHYIVSA